MYFFFVFVTSFNSLHVWTQSERRLCAWVGVRAHVEWGVYHVSSPYLSLLSFQSSSSSFTCLSETRRDSLWGREASWLCPPTSCFRGSRKDSVSSRYVEFWIPHLGQNHTEPRVMATSHSEYRGYLRNTIDVEAGQNRFQSVPTSESTYRSILFGTLVIMGLLQVASSIAILLHLTGYLQEVRLGVLLSFSPFLLFDIAGPYA